MNVLFCALRTLISEAPRLRWLQVKRLQQRRISKNGHWFPYNAITTHIPLRLSSISQGYVYARFNTLIRTLFHSFHKYLLSTYNITDIYLGTENTAMNKAGNFLPSRPFQAGAHKLPSACLELEPGLPSPPQKTIYLFSQRYYNY